MTMQDSAVHYQYTPCRLLLRAILPLKEPSLALYKTLAKKSESFDHDSAEKNQCVNKMPPTVCPCGAATRKGKFPSSCAVIAATTRLLLLLHYDGVSEQEAKTLKLPPHVLGFFQRLFMGGQED
jgi:hypothetical protein